MIRINLQAVSELKKEHWKGHVGSWARVNVPGHEVIEVSGFDSNTHNTETWLRNAAELLEWLPSAERVEFTTRVPDVYNYYMGRMKLHSLWQERADVIQGILDRKFDSLGFRFSPRMRVGYAQAEAQWQGAVERGEVGYSFPLPDAPWRERALNHADGMFS